MKAMKILVTGSSGLIGSEAVEHFDRQGHRIVGMDNNQRREFFGPAGDTTWNLERLKRSTRNFRHYALDIRDRAGVMSSSSKTDSIWSSIARRSRRTTRPRKSRWSISK